MAGLSYDKCVTAGHSAYPPTEVNATQSKVFTGGIAVLVDGDSITPHTKTVDPHDTHGGVVQPRTSKVFVTGKKLFKWPIQFLVATLSRNQAQRYSYTNGY
ncbi:PAAR motif of membran proteins [Klebsiella phage KPV15]|uniref:Phospholipase n=1 Tax=Klebsiella phage KPV15 TaxID=1913572 RepID=A0A1J0MHY9_9CAUD|nr:PAAR motif of membran proteins [Klebsiella phage KPV15]APD20546.1 phospholipase [Klebsiella phage KPV15]